MQFEPPFDLNFLAQPYFCRKPLGRPRTRLHCFNRSV